MHQWERDHLYSQQYNFLIRRQLEHHQMMMDNDNDRIVVDDTIEEQRNTMVHQNNKDENMLHMHHSHQYQVDSFSRKFIFLLL
jgi:hypothetical protein